MNRILTDTSMDTNKRTAGCFTPPSYAVWEISSRIRIRCCRRSLRSSTEEG